MKRIAPVLLLAGLSGCHTDMWIQPKVKPQVSSDFFPDQQGQRPLQPHTVSRGQYWTDSERYTGYDNNLEVTKVFPFKITAQDMARGQERFNIYCSPCHGALGNGQGMIAQRGFALRRPPGNYHEDRLRKAPVGHFYDVITNGYGTMYSYASRVEPDDRWRIVAYIRALQRSQNASRADVDDKDQRLTPAAKTQIDSYVPPPPGNNNAPGANGMGSATSPAPLADTPVPNTPANGDRQPAPGTQTPPNGATTPTGNGMGATPNGTGTAPGTPTIAPPAGATGSGTIRHDPVPTGPERQGGLRAPTTNGITPPSGGANGTGNR